VYDLKVREEQKKAEFEDMQAVRNAKEQHDTDQATALAPFKDPLDDQKTLVATDKATFDAKNATLTEKTQLLAVALAAWDARDQTAGVDNSGLETAKNDAQTAVDSATVEKNAAETKYNEEVAKVPALQATYDEKKAEKDEEPEQWEVDNTANIMWGKPAVEAVEESGTPGEADHVPAQPAQDAVEGVEEKMRKAEK
jgi:hypothetical protein